MYLRHEGHTYRRTSPFVHHVAKLLNFSQVANKNLHFALQKFYKAKCRKGFVKKITCYSSRRCITDHTAKAPRQPHLLQKEY